MSDSVPSQDRRRQGDAHRFKPTRAGVINLWDYVDEEFAFADGRLVLRGHNGSGKTKALEVLFPFILDGVADARRLDPFSGDNRTMKSNLLYRGQESEHGYVWMEFARPEETTTLVIGLRAHRHRDGVVTSFFVTGKRLGVDFGLLNLEGRPLTERQLRESLEPGSHAKTATDYRELVDNRLFGLGRERYDQLLDLLLALRRPLLAKDLDPAKVSATLTAGLSPVDDGLVEQAARDFENLAAVQHLHDDLTTAHTAVRAFLHHYTNYLRVHARFQLDRISARRDQAVDHGAQILAATTEAARARTAKAAAERSRATTDESLARLRSRLSTLKSADAYKAQGDLDRLRHQVADDESHLAKDSDRLTRSLHHATEFRTETEAATARLDLRRAAISRHESTLTQAAHAAAIPTDPTPPTTSIPAAAPPADSSATTAGATGPSSADSLAATAGTTGSSSAGSLAATAGITGSSSAGSLAAAAGSAGSSVGAGSISADAASGVGSADGSGPGSPAGRLRGSEPGAGAAGRSAVGDGAADAGRVGSASALASVRARATARRDDIAVVRAAVGLVDGRRADRVRAEKAQAKVADELRGCEEECATAETALGAARAAVRAELDGWVGRWEPVTAEPLFDALDRVGQPGAPTLGEVFADLSDARRTDLIEKSAEVKRRTDEVTTELADLDRERTEIATERDDAPQHSSLRPASREDRPGAPFWQLVRFADDLPEPAAASLEGALHAAGILTAWLHPTPAETRQSHTDLIPDAFLLPTGSGSAAASVPADVSRSAGGRTLADVLVAEEQELVPAEVILGVLRGIPLVAGTDAGSWGVSLSGQYSYGVHVGAYPKERPEYIGATFRAQRRKARIAECDAAVKRLVGERGELAAEAERLRGLLEDLGTARRELPDVLPVQRALSAADRVAALLGRVRGEVGEAARAVDGAIAELEAAIRRARQTAAERDLPTEPGEITAVAAAVDDFVAAGEQLAREHESLLDAERDLDSRNATLRRLDEQNAEDAENLAERREQVQAAREQLTARTEALGASLQEILRQISEVEGEIKTSERVRHDHDVRLRAEHDAVVKAEAAIEHGGRALAEAMDVLLEQIAAFEPFARPDLRPILGLTLTTLWPERWDAPAEIGARAVKAIIAGGDPAEAIASVLPEDAEEIIEAFGVATSGGRAPSETQRKNTRDAMSEALKEFSDALDDCEEDYRLDLDAADIVTVQIIDVEGRGSVSAFADRIAGRLGEQSVLLEERERTVLEDELLSSLAQQIFDRVQAAKGLVKGMDADTRSRPMSTGSTVGIRWVRSDKLDDSQRAVASLLSRDAQHLGATGLAELRGHLRQLIRARRTQQTRATYLEVLRSVVDYRTWFEFQLLLTEPHGAEPVRLTRAKHSQMSGGEKSAAIHLPLFAAANALYSSAKDTCPRMIALDEAFAGIDDRYKPELLGLTVKFDLDMFMTGHDLWASYPTVPMAAHYDMHSDKASHTVSAMLVLWDGTQLLDADASYSGNEDLTTALLGFHPHRRSPTAAGLLAPLLTTDP